MKKLTSLVCSRILEAVFPWCVSRAANKAKWKGKGRTSPFIHLLNKELDLGTNQDNATKLSPDQISAQHHNSTYYVHEKATGSCLLPLLLSNGDAELFFSCWEQKTAEFTTLQHSSVHVCHHNGKWKACSPSQQWHWGGHSVLSEWTAHPKTQAAYQRSRDVQNKSANLERELFKIQENIKQHFIMTQQPVGSKDNEDMYAHILSGTYCPPKTCPSSASVDLRSCEPTIRRGLVAAPF